MGDLLAGGVEHIVEDAPDVKVRGYGGNGTAAGAFAALDAGEKRIPQDVGQSFCGFGHEYFNVVPGNREARLLF